MKKGDKVIVTHNPIVEENFTFHEFSIGDIVTVEKVYDDEEWIVCIKKEYCEDVPIVYEQDLKIGWVQKLSS